MKKLTAQQIEKLYAFTKQHYVVYYDLQTELVDHLANGIELQWQENATLTFEEALKKEFKKYGIYGFSDIIEKKHRAMEKKYYKIVLQFIKEWFKFPKIVITSIIFMSLYIALGVTYGKLIILIALVFITISEIISFYKNRKISTQIERKNRKRWLLQEMIGNASKGFLWVLPINIINALNITAPLTVIIENFWFRIATALFLTLSIIVLYISAYILPKKAEELLSETYPEYKFLSQ